MNQKLADWASIAEIAGAIAVVVSLLFVGNEVRENTRATQLATANYMGMALLEVNKLTTDPELAALFVKMEKDK